MPRSHLPGDRHSMVPIQDEIHLSNLVDLNRRQPSKLRDSYFDARPSTAIAVLAGQEATREIPVTSHAANDGVQRDFFELTLRCLPTLQLLAHVIVRHQICRSSGQPSKNSI